MPARASKAPYHRMRVNGISIRLGESKESETGDLQVHWGTVD